MYNPEVASIHFSVFFRAKLLLQLANRKYSDDESELLFKISLRLCSSSHQICFALLGAGASALRPLPTLPTTRPNWHMKLRVSLARTWKHFWENNQWIYFLLGSNFLRHSMSVTLTRIKLMSTLIARSLLFEINCQAEYIIFVLEDFLGQTRKSVGVAQCQHNNSVIKWAADGEELWLKCKMQIWMGKKIEQLYNWEKIVL